MTKELTKLTELLDKEKLNYDVYVGFPGDEQIAVTNGDKGEKITGELVVKIMSLGCWTLYFDGGGEMGDRDFPHINIFRRHK